ncbi:MAG: hypothetical protein WD061_03455 [Candidatus Saccharimonadales bacterium]
MPKIEIDEVEVDCEDSSHLLITFQGGCDDQALRNAESMQRGLHELIGSDNIKDIVLHVVRYDGSFLATAKIEIADGGSISKASRDVRYALCDIWDVGPNEIHITRRCQEAMEWDSRVRMYDLDAATAVHSLVAAD